MGPLDWFRRRPVLEPAGDLREALIAALKAQHHDVMAQIVHTHVEAIRESFPDWRKMVPEEIKQNPEALQDYAQMLFAIATMFERSGDGSLMALLTAGNPMEQWDKDLTAARALIADHRAPDAVPLLQAILSALETVSGSAVQNYRPKVLGTLGIALAEIGDKREAVKVTKEALLLCQSAGDDEGIRVYTHNLDRFGTYEIPANDGTDANVTVAFNDERGHTLELAELKTVSGTVKWRGARWARRRRQRPNDSTRKGATPVRVETTTLRLRSSLERRRSHPRGPIQSTIGHSLTYSCRISTPLSRTTEGRSSSRLAASTLPKLLLTCSPVKRLESSRAGSTTRSPCWSTCRLSSDAISFGKSSRSFLPTHPPGMSLPIV